MCNTVSWPEQQQIAVLSNFSMCTLFRYRFLLHFHTTNNHTAWLHLLSIFNSFHKISSLFFIHFFHFLTFANTEHMFEKKTLIEISCRKLERICVASLCGDVTVIRRIQYWIKGTYYPLRPLGPNELYAITIFWTQQKKNQLTYSVIIEIVLKYQNFFITFHIQRKIPFFRSN